LASNTAIVTVATDNGVTYTTGGPQCERGLLLPSCYKFGTFQPTAAAVTGDGLLGTNTLVGTSSTFGVTPDGVRITRLTTYAANGDAGIFGGVAGVPIFHREWDAYLDTKIQVTNTTNSRILVGFSTDVTVDGNDNTCDAPDSCAIVAIRAADATYQYIVNDGVGVQSFTNSGIPESTGVVRIQVRFDSANNRVGFTINDNPEVFISADLPGPATNLFPIVLIENSAIHRQSIQIYYVYVSETK
jgi:hypothetical protein